MGADLNTDEIHLDPEVPGGLRNAAENGRVVPFVGAGVSRLAGCPGWSEFADKALEECVRNGMISHAQADQLRNLPPRTKFSIIKTLQEENSKLLDYKEFLKFREQDAAREIYGLIRKLSQSFVTTNYEVWLDKDTPEPMGLEEPRLSTPGRTPGEKNIIHKASEFKVGALNQKGTVIHLHGSVENPQGMVLGTSDYVRHYANDRSRDDAEEENRVLTFLENLFGERTVLFIGYGLEELEILEYVILKSQRTGEVKHYLLSGFYSHEIQLMRFLKKYFLNFGIELVPFLMDQKGHLQLIEVLKKFAEEIPAKGIMPSHNRLEMARLLE
jgi:hypothetical protein